MSELSSEAPSPDQPGEAHWTVRATFALLVAAGIAAVFVYFTRVSSWSNCWRWSITEGREGQTIYALWRVVHSEPLYTWPNQEPYALTYLNYGFYFAYGALCRVFSASGEELLWIPRVITALGAVVGTALFVSTAKLIAPPRGRLEWLALGALAFVVWFGTQFIAWWTISIRPDVWAAVFALAGLRLALPAMATAGVGRLVASSVLFFVGWSFKQSCILSFVGCMLSAALVARSLRAFLALAAPFGLLVATSLVVGGELYRFSIIAVPAASRLRTELLIEALSRAIPQNLWVFGFFPLVLAADFLRRKTSASTTLPVMLRTLALVVLVSVALGAIALGREGSNKNHLFEGYVASALASYWALHRLQASERAPRWESLLGVLLLLPLVFFPIAQIAMPNRVGRTVLCTTSDAAELRTLSDAFARLPKPLFTHDEIFSLPWHSTDGRHPAVVIDGTLHGIAKREGFLDPAFPARLFLARRFRTVVEFENHPNLSTLRARGSSCKELPGRPFGFKYVACSVSASPN